MRYRKSKGKLATVKTVRKMLNRQIETKFFSRVDATGDEIDFIGGSPPAAVTVRDLMPISQGTGDGQRVGDSVRAKSLYFEWTPYWLTGGVGTCRLVIYFSEVNQKTPFYGQVATPASVNEPLDISFNNKILYDSGSLFLSANQNIMRIKKRISLKNRRVTYNAGSSNNQTRNVLQAVIYSDIANSANYFAFQVGYQDA